MNAIKSHQKQIAIGLALLCAIAAVFCFALYSSAAPSGTSLDYEKSPTVTLPGSDAVTEKNGQYYGSAANLAQNYTSTYIVVKHKQLGASHYAYTEGVSDDATGSYPSGNEMQFRPGAQLVKLTLTPKTDGTVETKEEVLLTKTAGVIRDPDVSPDGKTVVFSMKEGRTNDDFHLYLYDLTTGKQTQITFGQGVADTEPKFLPDGKIVFSSSRDGQRVDCWYTVVSNLYRCDADGSNIIRLGYDQVHTTYPTVADDGRVIYTRWDYNDRNQMYVQAVFQMFQDGTNQTELYGNDTNWPTSLLHTRQIPGCSNKYVTIVSGHHVNQAGKLAIINLDKGSNNKDAIEFVFNDSYTANRSDSQDQNMMGGYLYKYPYAISENELLYAKTAQTQTPGGFYNSNGTSCEFDIYYYNAQTKKEVKICDGTTTYPASQIVPVIERNMFNRATNVNYGGDTGVYYVSNVYEGAGTPGVKGTHTAKYIRVVALDFRAYSTGAIQNPQLQASQTDDHKYYAGSDPHTPVGAAYTSWDVKRVLGIVEVQPDGSAMFEVPSETPVYFQLLDEDYNLIQSMRSWSTLQPGENFSCVGCHENSGSAPISTATVTDAMKKGVQTLKPDLWMDEDEKTYDPAEDSEGFSYLKVIQPILDKNCISCHNNEKAAFDAIGTADISAMTEIFPLGSTWKYKITNDKLSTSEFANKDSSESGWSSGQAAFGTQGDARAPSVWHNSATWTNKHAYFRYTFTLTEAQTKGDFSLHWQYDENPVVYINGREVCSHVSTGGAGTGIYITSPEVEEITIPSGVLVAGENVIAVELENTYGGQYFDLGLYCRSNDDTPNASPLSLQSTRVLGPREKMNYALSYLVLTGSKQTGDYFLGNSKNKYTNWISAIGQCEILDPYEYGSSKSEILKLLRGEDNDIVKNHKGPKLTDKEVQAISCWIDLACPFRGEYDEEEVWNSGDYRVSEELQIKQDYYNTLDDATKDVLGGIRDGETEITVSYEDSTGALTTTGTGVVNLYVPRKYATNSKITVTLPRGMQYVYVGINARLRPQLIFAKNGTFTLTLTSQMMSTKSSPSFLTSYTKNNIYVWLPTEEELESEYNVAYMPFGGTNVTVNASDSYTGNEFAPPNAVDGYRNNNGHGNYPVQSWGPNEHPKNLTYTVNFGHTVEIDHMMLYIRGDFGHDTYITSVKATFTDKDGKTTSQTFTGLTQTDLGQLMKLNKPTECVSVTLSDFQKANDTWFAISEFEVYGKNVLSADPEPDPAPIVPEYIVGDVNRDGKVNTADRNALARHLASWKGYEDDKIDMKAADVNADGKVNTADRNALARHLASWKGYETLPYTK